MGNVGTLMPAELGYRNNNGKATAEKSLLFYPSKIVLRKALCM